MPDNAPAQGGAPAASGAAASAPAAVVVPRQEIDAFTLRLVGRYGSAENALTHIAGEQLKYRKRAQRAESELADLQKKVPAAGAVVLTGDEAKAYTELTKDGLTLAKVPDVLKEHNTLKVKVSQESRDTALKTAAGEKYKPKVLAKLLGDTPIEFQTVRVRGKDDDGKDTIKDEQVAYVVINGTKEALDTYLEREHADWMDVLVVEETTEGGTNGTPKPGTSSGGSVTVPRQTAIGGTRTGTKDAAKDAAKIVDATLGARYQTPSQRAKDAAGTK
jgi:hypothetical protein